MEIPAGRAARSPGRAMERRETMKHDCGKPEWADGEPCPIDTGELEDCADCYWALEQDG